MAMSTTVEEVFTKTVRALPPTERLRLAALILEDLTQSNLSLVDMRDTWSDQDQKDLTAYSLQYAAVIYPEEKELA